MCGICGILNSDNQAASREVLASMTACLTHRGPDSDGFHLDAGLGLGFRRLAIIDLATGDQPIFSEDRAVVTIFNGEIYNYRELRAELEREGHVFATQGDTEVLVHGYESWGTALVDRLRGMYAFAIWDAASRELLLVRDRLGQKPLYYARWDGQFVFASEVKSILLHPAARRALNQSALPEYLALGYVLPPNTLFEGIDKLAPGHLMQIDADGPMQQVQYWQPNAKIDADISRTDAAQQTRARLETAVEMRMMSEVPLGTFLSGGVDSTAITALTGQFSGQAVKTFTVGFDFPTESHGDNKFNVDLHHARAAADHLGCDHHAIVIRHDDLLAALLPQLVFALDEPIADPAIMQTVFVTALARANGVPVLLSGDGADEIFGGYPFFRQADRVQRYQEWIPGPLRKSLIDPLVGLLPNAGRFDAAHKLVEKSRLPGAADHFLTWEANHELDTLGGLLADADLAQHGSEALLTHLTAMIAPAASARIAEQVGYARLRMWMAENSNTRFDKMSMWMSVEARSPFQDHELVDFALGLPLRLKLPDDGKAVLKDAVADLLPDSIRNRKKWGFTPPMSDWLRGPLRPLVDTYLAPERLQRLGLQSEPIQSMIADHMDRRGYYLHQIWNLLMLSLWHAIYIDESLRLEGRWSAEELFAQGG